MIIDIVYPLGAGSKWNNNELRYSLRSVEKYLTAVRNVYIVGDLPEWIQNVRHIPFQDTHRWKETRIALKIMAACKDPRVSNFFLFMNDDHFLQSYCQASEFPYLRKETLAATAQARRFNDDYRKSLVNSYMALTKNNHLAYNFDVHCPIVYQKDRFEQMFKMYDWDETNYAFVIKSMYCNTFSISGQPVKDLKINNPCDIKTLNEIVEGVPFFSIGDRAVNGDLLLLMENLYPEKSIYEK